MEIIMTDPNPTQKGRDYKITINPGHKRIEWDLFESHLLRLAEQVQEATGVPIGIVVTKKGETAREISILRHQYELKDNPLLGGR